MNMSDPVFMIAPTGKCGTNFLMKVLHHLNLVKAPDGPLLFKEDYLLYEAHCLAEYVEKTSRVWLRWSSDRDVLEQNKDKLLKNIGEGVLNFIGRSTDVPIAVKTPCSKNINLITRLFPDTKFIFIIRDGRDVSHSGVLSGYWDCLPEAFKEWAEHTRILLDFKRDNEEKFNTGVYHLFKYEELYQRSEHEIARLLDAFKAECNVRDAIEVMNALPVYGSSHYCINESGKFSWGVAQKTEDFKPVARWKVWDATTVHDFKLIAGKELIELGYEVDGSW